MRERLILFLVFLFIQNTINAQMVNATVGFDPNEIENNKPLHVKAQCLKLSLLKFYIYRNLERKYLSKKNIGDNKLGDLEPNKNHIKTLVLKRIKNPKDKYTATVILEDQNKKKIFKSVIETKKEKSWSDHSWWPWNWFSSTSDNLKKQGDKI